MILGGIVSLVVSDASPLINLARVGCFDLLAAFYERIIVPQAVYEEVVAQGEGRNSTLRSLAWLATPA